MPACIVFPDRTLIDMARRRPRNEAEFAEVNGVGDALDGRLAVKLKEFTGPFLAAIDRQCFERKSITNCHVKRIIWSNQVVFRAFSNPVIKPYAEAAAVVFKEFGALAVVECWGDDVPNG